MHIFGKKNFVALMRATANYTDIDRDGSTLLPANWVPQTAGKQVKKRMMKARYYKQD